MYKIKIMSIKLKNLKIKNFKCFAKEKIIDFSKITLLTGRNSSGKSSILHAILGPVQSGEFPFKFSPNGKYVNMGDFKEMSNKHFSKDISLSYTFKHQGLKSNYVFDTIWINSKSNSLPELKSFTLSAEFLKLSLIKNTKGYLLEFSYDPKKDPDYDEEKHKEITQKMLNNLIKSAELTSITDKKKFERGFARRKKYIESSNKKVSFKDFQILDLEKLDEEAWKKNNMNLNYTIDVLINMSWERYDKITNAISSFRHHPDRTYLEQSKDKLKVEKFGEGYLDQIILWEKNKSPNFKELQRIMKDDIGLLHTLRTNRAMGGGRYEVLVKTKGTGIETSLFDVGFGVNQFLPIIVADLQLGEGSTLFVAEPEIHLHPNVQAKFGDYLVSQIEKSKKNYVIETHSEYLLNRIRLAIVKGTLKESDLRVYYLDNNGDDAEIHELKFGKEGQIENAPDSFFDTYMMDVMDIALNV
jgi:predicted ATPase